MRQLCDTSTEAGIETMSERMMQLRTMVALTAFVAMVALLMPPTGTAGDAPMAGEIRAAVSDHTYQGSMSEGGSGFAEYYAPDGTIRGDGYTGEWTVKDGTMCFDYGEGPWCFEVMIDGPSMVMYKGGKIDGNGMLIEGNPLGF